MSVRWRHAAILTIALAALLAGCGGGQPAPTPTTTATPAPTATATPGPQASVDIVAVTGTPGEIRVTVETNLTSGDACRAETATLDVEGLPASAEIPIDACPDSAVQGSATLPVSAAETQRSVTLSATLSNGETATRPVIIPAVTPTPTPAPTATATPTPEVTATATSTPAPTATATATSEPTAAPTPTPTPLPEPEKSKIAFFSPSADIGDEQATAHYHLKNFHDFRVEVTVDTFFCETGSMGHQCHGAGRNVRTLDAGEEWQFDVTWDGVNASKSYELEYNHYVDRP